MFPLKRGIRGKYRVKDMETFSGRLGPDLSALELLLGTEGGARAP